MLPGGVQSFALGVSGDGSVIVGFGLKPSRQTEAWRAVLSLPV